jgi:protein TonB
MIAEKNPRYDFERKRIVFFQTGLLTIGAITLAAFTWKVPLDENVQTKIIRQQLAHDFEFKDREINEKKLIIIPKIKTENNKQQVDVKQAPDERSILTNKSSDPEKTVGISSAFQSGNFIQINPKIDLPDIDLDEIVIPDIEASFVGGYNEMVKFIQNELNYPQISQQLGVQGKVYLQFVVEKNGDISNVEIKRGVDSDIDREAKRIIRKMPKWIAGETRGKKVRTHVLLPINFILRN